jgi:hypothetical protein
VVLENSVPTDCVGFLRSLACWVVRLERFERATFGSGVIKARSHKTHLHKWLSQFGA